MKSFLKILCFAFVGYFLFQELPGLIFVKNRLNSLGSRLVKINPGEFEFQIREAETGVNSFPIKLDQGFWMMTTELTREQYNRLIPIDPERHPNMDLWCGDCPMAGLVSKEVSEFIQALNTREGCKLSKQEIWNSYERKDKAASGCYRLPTMYEWSFACLAGGPPPYGIADFKPEDMHEFAWYSENTYIRGKRVGMKKANAFGLYDMKGNVSEPVMNTSTHEFPGIEHEIFHKELIMNGSFRDVLTNMACSRIQRFEYAGGRKHEIGLRLVRNP